MVAAGADVLSKTAAVELASTRPRGRALVELEEAVVTQLCRRHLVVQPLDIHLADDTMYDRRGLRRAHACGSIHVA